MLESAHEIRFYLFKNVQLKVAEELVYVNLAVRLVFTIFQRSSSSFFEVLTKTDKVEIENKLIPVNYLTLYLFNIWQYSERLKLVNSDFNLGVFGFDNKV